MTRKSVPRRALILAAGRGERLRPLTDQIPKPVLEIGGRPLIEYPIRMLRKAGVDTVVVNVSHLAGVIESTLGNGRQLGIRIVYAPEPKRLDSGGPLRGLRDFFNGEPFWIANSDTIMDPDFNAIVQLHARLSAVATLVLRPTSPGDPYSRLTIGRTGRIEAIYLRRGGTSESSEAEVYRSPRGGCDARPFMYCGLCLCSAKLLDMLPNEAAFGLISGLLAPGLAAGWPIGGFAYEGFFRTVDDLASYELLRAEFAASQPILSFL